MTFIKKAVSVLLILSILISALFIQFSFNVSALSSKGTVIADSLNIRPDANTSGTSKGKVTNGATVQINSEKKGQTISDDGKSSDIWYNITYNGITGWVSSIYIKEIPDYTYDKDFETHISGFPESYKPFLRELHAQYPNWKFTPDNINMTFDEAVSIQQSGKLTSGDVSWRSMGVGGYDWTSKTWAQPEEGWYRASREVIKYYVDPRSYLNSSSVFAFLPHDVYDEKTQTENGLKNIISGTFLADNFDNANDYGGSYSKILIESGKQNKLNAYVLAGIIIQEQGTKGTSPIISGKYSGYEGYYNFFNIQAYGSTKDEIYKQGLAYAKKQNWNTRSASIIGGAKFCAEKYINVKQNTYYYMNFNVKNPSEIWHQYATAIHDTNSKARMVAKGYKDMPNAEINFLVPVYKNTPDEVSKVPAENKNMNNYYLSSISISGLTPSFYMFTYNYDLNVWGDTNINISVPDKAAYVGAKSFNLNVGNNKVVLTVKSQTGYTNDYVINVRADKACTLYINNPSAPTVSYKRGDSNGDGNINGRDLANIQMHILGVKKLSGDNLTAADTNSDGNVNGRDLANVQMDILGVRKLN